MKKQTIIMSPTIKKILEARKNNDKKALSKEIKAQNLRENCNNPNSKNY